MDVEKVANFLVLLSAGTNRTGDEVDADALPQSSGRMFECKTCSRQFPSFQALGGHRASHKKPRLVGDQGGAPKPKAHECHICGLEFPIGQALGGHMRRHRGSGAIFVAGDVRKTTTGTAVSGVHGKRRLGLDLNAPPAENDDEIRMLAFTLGLPPVAVDS